MTNTSTEIDSCTRAEIVIRESLSQGDSKGAVTEVMHALRAGMATLRHSRKGRPADGRHLDAQLAGTLLAIVHQVGLHQAPEGFPANPTGYDLLTVFQAAYEAAMAPNPGEGD